MDANEFFKGSQVGFKFLRIDLLSAKLGLAEAPLRFFIGILLGMYVKKFDVLYKTTRI